MDEPTLTGPRAERDAAAGGALERLARDDSSRKRFLRMMGGAGAASAFALVLAACGEEEGSADQKPAPPPSGSAFGEGDVGILNYALTLEYLEADFYDKAAQSGMLKGAALDTAKAFGENEQEHVDALKATVEQMGARPAGKPRAEFPLESQKAILELAATVENVGAAAYLGQVGEIQNEEVLAAALSIHSVEARHAATLNTVIGRPIAPDGAFARPMTMDEVLKAVQPFIKS